MKERLWVAVDIMAVPAALNLASTSFDDGKYLESFLCALLLVWVSYGLAGRIIK